MMNDPFESVSKEQLVSGNLQNYTIDALFQQVMSATQGMGLIDINGRIYIDFDAELGFVSRFTISDCGQGGLLGPRMGECSTGLRVKSVDLLN